MKKARCFLLIIVFALLLSACANGKHTSLLGDTDSNLADARMEQLFDAIKSRNRDDIKSIFSQKAIEEANAIDADIERLLSFIKGNAVSWNREESPAVLDSVEHGGKTKQIITWYVFNTDAQSYLVLLVDYPVDTINPHNAGLYAIRILKTENEEKLTGTLEEWVVPGIYILED